MKQQQIPQGYKLTEVGVIPDDWDIVQLKELFKFKNGLNKEKEFFGYGYPIINYMDVFKHTGLTSIEIQGRVFVSAEEMRAYQVKRGDVFFTRTSETVEEIGVTSVLLENIQNGVFSGFVLRARDKINLLEVAYKRYCFSSTIIRKQIISTASYTTRALTNGVLLGLVQLPFPKNNKEQTAIANALADIDALINQLKKLIVKKQAIKTATMQQLLTGKTRLPAFAYREDGSLRGTKQSDLGEIPEDWVFKKLGELCFYQNGTALEKYFNQDDGYKVISIGNYSSSGGYIFTSNYIDYSYERIINKFILNQNDLAILLNDKTSIGTIIGRVILIRNDNEYVFNQRTMRLTPKGEILPDYIYYLINSDFIHNIIVNMAKPGTQIYINTDDILNLYLPFPTVMEEQIATITILLDMDKEITTLEQRLAKTELIKQGMMQELLTGKTRLI